MRGPKSSTDLGRLENEVLKPFRMRTYKKVPGGTHLHLSTQ